MFEADPCERFHGGNPQSTEAHLSIVPSKEILCDRIVKWVAAFGTLGATCDEIELGMNLSHQTASARCTELLAENRITRTVAKRKTRSGRNAAVLVAVLKQQGLFA
jgi:hypothetical protein